MRSHNNRSGPGAGVAAPLLVALLALAWAPQGQAQPRRDPPARPTRKVGLMTNKSGACTGYTLIAPMNSRDTYLIDLEGRVVHTWKSDATLGSSAYLLENGHLLRTAQMQRMPFGGPAFGGRIQEFSWDGKVVWDYTFGNDRQMPHHDICRLPNGNVLMIVCERKTAREAVAAGRRPETVRDHLLSDCVLEVKPTGKNTGEVVWEWHAWDHLVQEFDSSKANFDDVGKHPGRIDVNFGQNTIDAMIAKPEELKKLQALGYVGGAGRRPGRVSSDWLHVNGISYNADLDQIMLCVHEFSELWVIDHSTTKAEAATDKGGKSGKGGRLLYRWGNPRAYRAGGVKDQQLFSQHNAHWIPRGRPGAGNILVFNNGLRRIGGAHSTVDEIVPPVQGSTYKHEPGKAYGPEKAVWSYSAPKRTDFYSALISGAQRLSNGNTLICSGTDGTLFEVTAKKETVWKYVNPAQGGMGFPGFGPPRPGQIVPSFLRGIMGFSAEQSKKLDEVEKTVGAKLDRLLTESQKRVLREPPSFRPGSFPRFGQLVSDDAAKKMKLSDAQKKELAALQKDADAGLDKLLNDDQKKRVKDMREGKGPFSGRPGPGRPPGPPGRGPRRGPGGPGGPGFGGPGGPRGPGGPGGGLFRAPRYEVNYPGLAKDLKPGKKLEEVLPRSQPNPPRPPRDRN
jgi:Arylsulfotransferase (ASST)